MNVADFPLLVDENVRDEVAVWLRSQGFDVRTVAAAGLSGSTDLKVLQAAVSEGRVVVTRDRDFGKLAVVGDEPVIGIFYLRPGHIDPQFTIGSLQAVMSQPLDLRPPFILVALRTADRVTLRLRLL